MVKNVKMVGTLDVTEMGLIPTEKGFTVGTDLVFNGMVLTGNAVIETELEGAKSKNITFNVLLEKEIKEINYIKSIAFKSKSEKPFNLTLVNNYKLGVKKNNVKGYVKEGKEAGFIWKLDEEKKMVIIGSWLSANTVINQLMLITGKSYQSCDTLYKTATLDRMSKNSTSNRQAVKIVAVEY